MHQYCVRSIIESNIKVDDVNYFQLYDNGQKESFWFSTLPWKVRGKSLNANLKRTTATNIGCLKVIFSWGWLISQKIRWNFRDHICTSLPFTPLLAIELVGTVLKVLPFQEIIVGDTIKLLPKIPICCEYYKPTPVLSSWMKTQINDSHDDYGVGSRILTIFRLCLEFGGI